MALEIDTTIGGDAANSYVLKADVDSYALAAFDAAAWSAVPDTATKNIYIIRAARQLDRLVRFAGERVSRTQKLEWPRYWVPHPACGYYLSSEIPQAIKDAQCEMAIFIAAQGSTDDPFAPAESAQFDSLSIGPITLDFLEGNVVPTGTSFLLETIRPILAAGNCIGRGGRLVR